jgi:hypothetical protein
MSAPNGERRLRRWAAALIAVLGLLVVGTWSTVGITTNYLLEREAAAGARNWAEFLAANIGDLEQIAAGEQPVAASMAFFEIARKSGQVFRYVIFNRDGYSQLVSDRERIALVDLSEFSLQAASAMTSGSPQVDFRKADMPALPAYYAAAYVPVRAGDRPVAVVAAWRHGRRGGARASAAGFAAELSRCAEGSATAFSDGTSRSLAPRRARTQRVVRAPRAPRDVRRPAESGEACRGSDTEWPRLGGTGGQSPRYGRVAARRWRDNDARRSALLSETPLRSLLLGGRDAGGFGHCDRLGQSDLCHIGADHVASDAGMRLALAGAVGVIHRASHVVAAMMRPCHGRIRSGEQDKRQQCGTFHRPQFPHHSSRDHDSRIESLRREKTREEQHCPQNE